MKTQLTEKELNFYNALIENKNKTGDDSFLERVYYAEPIINKLFNEIDFYFDIKLKKDLLSEALILFHSLDGVLIGKLKKYFWYMDKYGDIYFISTKIEDIANQMLNLFSGLDINQDPNLENFYYMNEYKYGKKYRDIINKFKFFTKQYGYDFDLMKDIDDYEGIEEDIEEFNKLLASYGIKNEDE